MRFCEASSLLLLFFLSTCCPQHTHKAFIFHSLLKQGKVKRAKRTLSHVCGSYLQFAAELSRAPKREVPPTNQH